MRSIKEIFLAHAELDAQGRHVNGMDKATNHNYSDAYESLFRGEFDYASNLCPWLPTVDRRSCSECASDTYHRTTCSQYAPRWKSLRNSVELVMEVGVADGSCLCAWRDIFPNAHIVGMDIHHSDRAHGERIEFHLGDQRRKEDCERAAGGRLFDFIVEDATHKLENSLLTLLWLWPFVRPGGLYVVEEWEGITGTRDNVRALFPFAEIVGTCGPHIQDEPLVVLRKPL